MPGLLQRHFSKPKLLNLCPTLPMMKSVRTGQPHDHVPCYFTGCKRERIASEFSLALLFWTDSVYLGTETEGSLLISMVWVRVWLITAAVRFGGWSMNMVMIIIIISTGNFFTAHTFNIHLRNLSLNLRWTEIHSLTCSDRFQATGVNFSESVLSQC